MRNHRPLFSFVILVATIANAGPSTTFISGVTVATDNGAALQIANPNERNASFDANIQRRKLHGRIAACSSLVDVPVGTAHGNHSFGGLCTLVDGGNKASVMICDDEMVGHFRMEKIDHKVATQELINFIISNCFGG